MTCGSKGRRDLITQRRKRGRPHLVGAEAEVVGQDLPVAEPAREVVDDVLVVQLVVLVQVLLEALLL